MNNKNLFQKFVDFVERYLPMSFSSFIIFVVTIYAFVIVGRSIWVNYNSNKDIQKQEENLTSLESEVKGLELQINYFQTLSFKEKEAREKLGYKAPGENVVSLPMDKEEDKVADKELGDVQIKTPNYILWWNYFFD